MSLSLCEKSALIKQEAQRLGFDACGIAPAGHTGNAGQHLTQWLEANHHAEMGYMANHFDKRCNPTLLVEGSKSVIVFALNYYPQQKQPEHLPQIAYYAYGNDYHDIIKQKLFALMEYIHREIEPAQGRAFVDSAPVMERYWAQQAGLGWIGKNNMLIIPGKGSFFFLAELILNIELAYDTPFPSSKCGNCHRCIEACPTQTLQPHNLDARRCLSYLTIEKKGDFPDSDPLLHNRLFGCDLCQIACPWNKFSSTTSSEGMFPKSDFLHLDLTQWQNLSETEFRERFCYSPIKRTGYAGIKRNMGCL